MNRSLTMSMFLLCLCLSGCTAGYTPVVSTSPKVPSGTEVPFSKVMDPTFASDYIGSDIITVAEFVGNGTGILLLHYPMDGKVIFRSRPPGVPGEKNPLSGEVSANFVVLAKDKSDIVFTQPFPPGPP
jgi:hypothetical protein